MLLVPAEVRSSPIHGIGVFVLAPVAAGEIVWQFDPGIDHRHPLTWLDSQPPHVRAHCKTYGVVSLDGAFIYLGGDHTMFLNHSDTPNLVPCDDVLRNSDGVVVAARNIAAGEELTIDYGTIDGGDRAKQVRGVPLFR